MASPVHFFSPQSPITGKVYHTAVSSSQAIDVMGTIGQGGIALGGYISYRATGDTYVAFGQTGATVTVSGASAGWYVPTGVELRVELPECSTVTGTSGYQYLWVTAGTGTVQTYIYKSSAPCVTQYMRYIRGIVKGGV